MVRQWSNSKKEISPRAWCSSPMEDLSIPLSARIPRRRGCRIRKGSRWRLSNMAEAAAVKAVIDAKDVTVVEGVTCPFCGVCCDDLEVHVGVAVHRPVEHPHAFFGARG